MDFLDIFGDYIASYEGKGTASFADEPHQASVYFRVRQLENGRVVAALCCDPGNALDRADIIGFVGDATSGERIETTGPLSRVTLRQGPVGPAMFRPQAITAHTRPNGYVHTLVVAVANLIFGPLGEAGTVSGTSIQVNGYDLTINPIKDYQGAIERMVLSGRIAQTAQIIVRRHGGGPLDVEEAMRIVSSTMIPLSLATSSMVNWLSYRASNVSDESLYTVHGYTFTRPFYTAGAIGLNLWSDLGDVVNAWHGGIAAGATKEAEIVNYILAYNDACSSFAVQATAGLTAAALLDVLAFQYTNRMKKTTIIPGWAFRRVRGRIRPLLRRAVRRVSRESRTSPRPVAPRAAWYSEESTLIGNLDNLNRSSFRQRFKVLIGDLKIAEAEPLTDGIIKTRNKLIHEGHFVSNDEPGKRREYLTMLWIARAILLRMIGYQGSLPLPDAVNR